MTTDEDFTLTIDEAISVLADGDEIHTYQESKMAMIGVTLTRGDVIAIIRTTECRALAGELATSGEHGLAVWYMGHWMWVATDRSRLEQCQLAKGNGDNGTEIRDADGG